MSDLAGALAGEPPAVSLHARHMETAAELLLGPDPGLTVLDRMDRLFAAPDGAGGAVLTLECGRGMTDAVPVAWHAGDPRGAVPLEFDPLPLCRVDLRGVPGAPGRSMIGLEIMVADSRVERDPAAAVAVRVLRRAADLIRRLLDGSEGES